MEQNHIHSHEAATDEPAFPSSLTDEAGRTARRHRHDGWTPERQTAFLEALAACGVVADACRQVALSAQSAYAFRNRRSGRAFAIAWDAVLVHRARGRLSDELMSRAMNGCIEAVHQNGEMVGERHRFDNRLSMAVLTRLDRLAERQGDKDEQLRAVSEDLDDFLDCIEEGGDANAFVEERRPQPQAAPELEPGAELAPQQRAGKDWDMLADMIGCPHYKRIDPADIDSSDLSGPDVTGCDMEQYLRAHYSGYLTWVEMGKAAAQDGDEEVDESPEAYMEQLQARRERALRAGQPPLHGAEPAPRQPSTSSTYRADAEEPAVEAFGHPGDMRAG